MTTRRPRLKDIAQAAGVSVSAVSMALAGDDRISTATRRKVETIARELGYRRQPRAQRTALIAVIFSDARKGRISSFFHQAFEGIIDEAMVLGARLLVSRCNGASDVDDCMHALNEAGVQGMIVLGGNPDVSLLHALIDQQAQFVCIGKRSLPGVELSWVSSDYLRGSQEAVEHLIALGHKRIALILNKDPHHEWYEERILGYQVALASQGLEPGPQWTVPNVEETVARLRAGELRKEGVTAAFAIDYTSASCLLTSCRIAGVDVPGELAVVGFDDPDEASSLHPPLTTVRQPMHQMGAMAVRTVLSWLQGSRPTPVQSRLATTLVVRQSCGGSVQGK